MGRGCTGGPGGDPLSGAVGLIEIEVRGGVRFGGIEGGRLVEIEERIGVIRRIFRRRRTGGGQRWRGGGKSEVAEDAGHGEGIGQEGEDAHLATAVGADEREDLVDSSEKPGPTGAGGAPGRGRRVGVGSSGQSWGVRDDSAQGSDTFAQTGVGSEDAMVAVPVDAGRWDQPGQRGQEVERREDEQRAPVGRGT